ncbi:antitoxin Xre/MbcA/ParS toxin-binding domain-containing protein [Pseudomonadota bacterium 24LQ007]
MIDQTRPSNIASESESIVRYAAEVFECQETALEWLESPVVALGGRRPSDLCQTQQGREQVAKILRKIELGEFT